MCACDCEWVWTRIMYTASVWLWPNLIIHQRVERNNHNHKCTATSVVCNLKTPKKNIHSKNKFLQHNFYARHAGTKQLPLGCEPAACESAKQKIYIIYIAGTLANASMNALKWKERARAHALTQTNDEWEAATGILRHSFRVPRSSGWHGIVSASERQRKHTRREHEN